MMQRLCEHATLVPTYICYSGKGYPFALSELCNDQFFDAETSSKQILTIISSYDTEYTATLDTTCIS